ncbi:hypothetical protein NW072_00885 [Mycoplasmopsis felis]|uniref:hypothetical protein n=1 Tax=Mycoplasmopsis felis TaxID=33923 RepID=UPI0021AF0944|nr:hypothetical protein [Mycoplasmopsis felis]UWV79748.1 hypothetical protein NW072_00885 [Mycoplasmopsis felis]
MWRVICIPVVPEVSELSVFAALSCCDTSSRFSNIQPWSISDFNASFTGVSLKAKPIAHLEMILML